jgi:hypothetical protein
MIVIIVSQAPIILRIVGFEIESRDTRILVKMVIG